MIVRAAPVEHFGWLCRRIGYTPTLSFRAIEAVDGAGRVRGMVGFDLWTDTAVWFHVAVDDPMALRALIGPGFRYPFEQLGREIALASVRSDNARSRALCRKVGFREAWSIKDGISHGVDLVVYELRKADCRWLARTMRKAA
jgi:RimJ/RimL family protein N-acetyltransferase